MCLLLPLKSWSTRGASHHPAFKGNYLTISHTFLTLSTQWVSSSPSRKWRREVSPRFHLIAFRGRVLAIPTQLVSSPSREWRHGVSSRFHLIFLCLMWIKRIRRSSFSCVTPVVETFSCDRVEKQPTVLTLISHC